MNATAETPSTGATLQPAGMVTENSAISAGAPSGALLGISRAGVVVLLVLALANGLFLYFFPSHAATDFAWRITPPINAAFLGAGYLAGAVATALVVFATRSWRSLRTLPLALVVLAVGHFVATLSNSDRFRWDYPPTWLWTAVYALAPFGVAYLWWQQERREPPAPPAHPALRTLRVASAAMGGLVAVAAVAGFAAPGDLADLWPWPLTPLLTSAVACWYALVATSLIVCAVSLRRPAEAVIPYATLASWAGLLLLLPVLHHEDVTRDGVELAVWTIVQAALLALAGFALIRSVPLGLREHERLWPIVSRCWPSLARRPLVVPYLGSPSAVVASRHVVASRQSGENASAASAPAGMLGGDRLLGPHRGLPAAERST